MIKCFFVDVSSISSDIPRSNFEESDLEQLADLILQTDGLLRPLILKKTGTEKYKVLEGHREYYAAVKAKEKDKKKAEMVNAFVVSARIQSSAIDQLKLLEADRASIPSSPPNIVNVEQLLPTLLAAISQQIQPIVDQLARHQQILDVLKVTSTNINQTTPQPEPEPEPNPVVVVVPQPPIIDEIEIVKPPETSSEANEIVSPSGSIDSIKSDPLTLINTLSQEQLSLRMERSGISKAIVKLVPNLVATRSIQSDRKFESWEKIGAAKITGLAAGRIKEIKEKLK